MTVDVKKIKRDPNNFIHIILNKLTLVKEFHQRIDLSITSKVILNCATLKFYIRRRHQKVFLYTRFQGNFGSIKNRHLFISDFIKLIPSLQIESTKGHYSGLIIEINESTNNDLIMYLKLLSLLSKAKDFYKKETKAFISYYNYINTSQTPIHLRFTHSQLNQLLNLDLKSYLNSIKEQHIE